MSRNEKLIQKVENHRKGLFPFADLRRYLELYNWRHAKTTGSHNKFRHVDGRVLELTIPVVKGRFVRATYVRKAVQLVKEDAGPEAD